MNRSPHASHLHPNWGKDALWHAGIGIPITSDDVKSVNVSPLPAQPVVALPPKIQLTVIHPKECIYLGKVISRVSCGSCRRDDSRQCNLPEFGSKIVTQNTACESCTEYVEE